ncbi:MAG: zinc-dependent alcohol dehydrogenase family protein [Deltaproteobacteria bacterium]|jgi:propanol-preferring alcohol dehydrogenase|nr:zinc-dependent alcohol dehydrogenase family protein [Deltaproteobacteria bacterium]
MKAMILNQLVEIVDNKNPLALVDMPDPVPRDNEILIKVSTCGVCHTELDEIEGRTPPPRLPVILGHQIVGRVAMTGAAVTKSSKGERVGIAWIHSACGRCHFCRNGAENLCEHFKATGRDVHGGYAEYTTVSENFVYKIPEVFTDSQAAPLLCAGAIGYRSMRLSGVADHQNLGLTGFGASAHLVLKMVRHKYPNTNVFVFARSEKERDFALQLGAFWAGDTAEDPPEKLDSIIDTTPAWKPVIEALACLKPGGRLVINAIRKEESDKKTLLTLDYPHHLWQEKEIKSVANVARTDVSEFLQLAAEIQIKPEVQEFELEDANRALIELKQRKIRGAKVLKIG